MSERRREKSGEATELEERREEVWVGFQWMAVTMGR